VTRGIYGDSESCNVLLQAPAGQTVRITVTFLSTERNYDFVKVYDGPSATSRELISASGNAVPAAVTSTGNMVSIQWTSDSSVTANGFSLTYIISGGGAMQSPSNIVPVTVGSSTLTSKVVTLPMAGMACTSPCGRGCRLNTDFADAPDTFRLAISGRQLTVTRTDLTFSWDMNLIVPCTAGSVPSPVPPPSPTTDICTGPNPRSVTTTAAVVSRGAYSNSESCSVSLQAAAGRTVRITFISLNTEANNDVIKIYDGSSAVGTPMLTASGSSLPAVLTSRGRNVYVQWTTNSAVTGSGWSFSYVVAGGAAQSPLPLPSPSPSPSPSPASTSFGNDLCPNADSLVCGGHASGSTVAATFDDLMGCSADESNGLGIWYTLDVADAGDITLSTMGSSYDTQLSIFTGADCDSLSCIDANDDAKKVLTFTSRLTVAVNPGRYYVVVHGYQGNVGNVLISATCGNGATTVNAHRRSSHSSTSSHSSLVTGAAVAITAVSAGLQQQQMAQMQAGCCCGIPAT